MSRKKSTEPSTFENLVNSADAADLIVLSFGFYAGWEGGTALDGFLKHSGMSSSMLDPFKLRIEAAQKDPMVSAAMGVSTYLGFAATLNPFVSILAGNWMAGLVTAFESKDSSSTASPAVPQDYAHYAKLSNDQKAALNDATKAKIAMGCLGAILAYAVTRPGFLPALIGMAGDLIGNVTKIPIPV